MSDPMPEDENQAYGKEQVVKIINSVISKVEEAEGVSKDAIYLELKELKKVIDDARKDIGLAKPGEIGDKHIPTATDELDAVVAATAEATGTIMDCCDVIMDKAGEAGGDAGDAMIAEVTKIYEACSFQDITGQRITKVVDTLKIIDEKVEKLVAILGEQAPGTSAEDSAGEEQRTGDEALLNGPQMVDKALSQDDINKLLEEFD